MIITSTDIVSLCSKLAALSSNQANLGTADFLNFANLNLMSLASEIMEAREEYLIYQESLAVTAGTANYRIPYRAINGVIRHLWFEDGTGSRFRLWPKTLESIEDFQSTQEGTPDGFYIMGNNIVLLPTPNISGNLVVAYPFRPSLLVDASNTATITNVEIDVVNGQQQQYIYLNNFPASMQTALQARNAFDVIDNTSGNGIVGYDLFASSMGWGGSNYLELVPPVTGIKSGQYVCASGQSPVPMIPEEGHPLLLEQTVMRIEMLRGNAARIKNSASLVQDARRAWDALLNNRVISKAHPTGGGNVFLPGGARPW